MGGLPRALTNAGNPDEGSWGCSWSTPAKLSGGSYTGFVRVGFFLSVSPRLRGKIFVVETLIAPARKFASSKFFRKIGRPFVLCLLVYLAGATVLAQTSSSPSPAPPQKTKTKDVPSYSDSAPASSDSSRTISTALPTQPSANRKPKYEIVVQGSQPWTDTGIDLLPQDQISIRSKGHPIPNSLSLGNCDPQGLPRSWWDLLHALPVNSSGRDALIGRIGDASAAVPFLVGTQIKQRVQQGGRLFLGVNEVQNIQAPCSFAVTVSIQAAAKAEAKNLKSSAQIVSATSAAANAATNAPPAIALSPDLLNQIPRRVSDAGGNPGDMVNFIIMGPEKRLQPAFAAAGWVAVDRTSQDATVHAILSSISKKAYVEMPMSELFLFNRPQDFGYARATPLEVVASRHHLRMWRAPFDWNSQPVWVGAATHDIGFDRDNRDGGITHKIDPAIDLEREFVGRSLNAAGALGKLEHLLPPNPLLNANTATGEAFHSDGQILVMLLR